MITQKRTTYKHANFTAEYNKSKEMIAIKNNLFYPYVFTPEGICTQTDGCDFCCEKSILLFGCSDAVKRIVFNKIKAELTHRKIEFTDLSSPCGGIGICCPDLDFKIIDGDICEVKNGRIFPVNISDYQDSEVTARLYETSAKLLTEKAENIRRAKRFFSACRLISNDIYRTESALIDRSKTERFIHRLTSKIPAAPNKKLGEEKIRYITCPTGGGVELNYTSFDTMCDSIIIVRDHSGAVASVITESLRRFALGCGYDVISCRCCLDVGRTEHLIIPYLRTGIFTSGYYHRDDFPFGRKIYARRFLSRSADEINNRISFCLRAKKSMMNEVFVSLSRAEECDRRLGGIFLPHTDVAGLCRKIEKIALG